MKIVNGIYELIGNTPIVKLQNRDENSADIYLKLEWFNPGGSVKDRIALNMIEMAEKEGLIKPGDTIVEPTSGNTGIGIAMVGAAKGYKVVLTMPESMSIERRKLLSAYGAELVLTPAAGGMGAAINLAAELAHTKGYFLLQQFENKANPAIHRETTAKEIVAAFEGKLDAFVAGVGTGGTLTGVGEVLKKEIPEIEVVAVEPTGSAVLSGEDKGPHKIQGIGAGFIPGILNTEVIDSIEKVTDEEAFSTARALPAQEGLLVGISTGAAIEAARRVAKRLGKGKKVLAVSPSNGERYLSTPLFSQE